LGCGTVVDAEMGQETVAELGELISQESDFQVASQRVDFYGWCSGCTPDGES
jgi:Fe2+ or Zn2+ uptake regulation protein